MPPGERLVFGKIAAPHQAGDGVREADIELFDDVAPAPRPRYSPLPSRQAPCHPNSTAPVRHPVPGRGNADGTSGSGKGKEKGKEKGKKKGKEKGKTRYPVLLIGVTVAGIGAAIAVYLVCVAITNQHSGYISSSFSAASPSVSPTPSEEAPRTSLPAAPATIPASPVRELSETPVAPSAPPSRSATPPPSPPPPSPTPPPPPSPASTRSTDRNTIGLGSTGPEVKDLQRRLGQLYLYLGSPNGIFTQDVQVALSRFQKARNIPEELGIYGPLTRGALVAETDSSGRDSYAQAAPRGWHR
ncbi:peptidoglycan-binding domain-containing protein [Streptomyces sp. CLV115]|uniref:peptidoglycan-binding domain-containing protein n=1 Tax=Streptomyces sp. CLV115 TaxID=3138502 RepID=UPI00406CD860